MPAASSGGGCPPACRPAYRGLQCCAAQPRPRDARPTGRWSPHSAAECAGPEEKRTGHRDGGGGGDERRHQRRGERMCECVSVCVCLGVGVGDGVSRRWRSTGPRSENCPVRSPTPFALSCSTTLQVAGHLASRQPVDGPRGALPKTCHTRHSTPCSCRNSGCGAQSACARRAPLEGEAVCQLCVSGASAEGGRPGGRDARQQHRQRSGRESAANALRTGCEAACRWNSAAISTACSSSVATSVSSAWCAATDQSNTRLAHCKRGGRPKPRGSSHDGGGSGGGR